MSELHLDAGDLIHRITLQRGTAVLQPTKEKQLAWSNVGTYFCRVSNLSGQELAFAQQIWAKATHKVQMRNVFFGTSTPPVTTQDRFSWVDQNGNNQTLNIGYVNPLDNYREGYEILCSQKA